MNRCWYCFHIFHPFMPITEGEGALEIPTSKIRSIDPIGLFPNSVSEKSACEKRV